MTLQLRLNVDQVSAAIALLSQKEKKELKRRLPLLMGISEDDKEDAGWLHLTESAFSFWDDEEEDIYQDLAPTGNAVLG